LKWDEVCSFSPLFTLFRAAYTPSFALRAERRKTKRVKRGKLHPILRTAHQKWRGVRFKMGGANLNFEVRLRGEIIIFKINKKYHENQREKLILMIFFSNESLIHAPTLLSELLELP
jgi:hypothetical protein